MNKIKVLLATLVMLCAGLVASLGTASPAQAAWGTDVTHAADDSGYNAPIHIVCTNGSHKWLGLGESTFFDAKACGYGGVQYIYAGPDQAVWCKNAAPPYNNHYFIGGYREVPSYASLKCYMQRPI